MRPGFPVLQADSLPSEPPDEVQTEPHGDARDQTQGLIHTKHALYH